MIGRLVELLIRLYPMVQEALHLTYSRLFMDEFQDTTQVQYDLVRAIFLGSEAIVTAVGDRKQQIMRWAMAMHDPFGAFDADFNPKRTALYNNYRSSPELVRIQHILAKALDPKSVKSISKTTGNVAGESCVIWEFQSPEGEAVKLADFVAAEIEEYDLEPRDFVFIVRQKAGTYEDVLQPAFADIGISIRNEAEQVGAIMLQDRLAEEASDLVIRVLRLAMTKRGGRYWTECQEELGRLRNFGVDDENEQARFARELDGLATRLGRDYPTLPIRPAARKLVDDVIGFIGRGRLVAAYPAYGQGDWLEEVLASTAIHLAHSGETRGSGQRRSMPMRGFMQSH